MYLREIHAEPSYAILRQFIHDNPLGVLTTFIPSLGFPSLQQTHIPWVLDDPTDSDSTGVLRGHLARANPHAKALIQAASLANTNPGTVPEDVTVLFTLAASHYITPHYYISTKPDTGKVVPTYNYAAVQIYGRLRVYHDSKSAESGQYLQKQIEDLTKEAETRAGYSQQEGSKGRAWEISDAPKPFIDILKKSILGIEVEITDLQGKFKMSQELKDGDRLGVINGLSYLNTENADEIAKLVRQKHEERRPAQ